VTRNPSSAHPRRQARLLQAGPATLAIALIVSACAGGASGAGWGPGAAVKAPPAAFDPPASAGVASETAVLSGGCFWGLQGVFEHVRGVRQVLAGYAGGPSGLAQYELVSTGTTGHAESVKIVFDPHKISYGEILRIYFSVATDPTELNQQFPDEGPQYRGDIFYLDGAQQAVAKHYIAQLEAAHVYKQPIVTRLDLYKGFFPAEPYHQDYLLRHPDAAYIATYDMPKVAALKSLFPANYRANPLRSL
jgi:peptide-methionine (S)-S-oxide reductase